MTSKKLQEHNTGEHNREGGQESEETEEKRISQQICKSSI